MLAARLGAACAAHGAAIAIEGPAERWTYAALDAAADQVAARLARAGCASAEPVVVAVSNEPRDFAAFLGVWRAGGVVVPVHRSSPPAALDATVAACGARTLVDGDPRRVSDRPPPARSVLDDAAFVIYTSGSTGQPKGVVLSHRAFAGKLDVNERQLGFAAGERTLLVLNITFSFGIWVGLATLARGGVLLAQPKFAPASFLDALARVPVARVGVVPTMMRALFASGLVPAVSPRQILIGGEPLGAALASEVRAAFPGACLIDIYGLTETSTSDFYLFPEDAEQYAGCIGRPAPGVVCRVCRVCRVGRPDGRVASDGEVGELQLATPFIMNGYLDQPDLTAAAFSEKWFRTGDMGRVVARDGRGPVVQLAGRLNELISRGGNKLSPLEIEQVVAQHPQVAAAMVAGLPDAILGERVHALVVPRLGATVDVEALRAFCAARLDRYKIPDTFYVGDALPLGRTGKADRGGLRALIDAGTIRPLAS